LEQLYTSIGDLSIITGVEIAGAGGWVELQYRKIMNCFIED
jgi:hypothetical protein